MSMMKRKLEDKIYEIADKYGISYSVTEIIWENCDGDVELYDTVCRIFRTVLDEVYASESENWY